CSCQEAEESNPDWQHLFQRGNEAALNLSRTAVPKVKERRELEGVLRKADPKSLGDKTLGEICAETRAEQWLLLGGCLGSVASFFLLLLTLLIFGDLAHSLFLGPALTAAALLWAHHLAGWPKRGYRKELAYRRGLGPRLQYVAEAEAILRQREADWVLLF